MSSMGSITLTSGDGYVETIAYDAKKKITDPSFKPIFEQLSFQVNLSESKVAGNSYVAFHNRRSKYDALFMSTVGRLLFNEILCWSEKVVLGKRFQRFSKSQAGRIANKICSVALIALGALSCVIGSSGIITCTVFPPYGIALAVSYAASFALRATQVFVKNHTVQKIACIADAILGIPMITSPVLFVSTGVGLMAAGKHMWNPLHSSSRFLEVFPHEVDMRIC